MHIRIISSLLKASTNNYPFNCFPNNNKKVKYIKVPKIYIKLIKNRKTTRLMYLIRVQVKWMINCIFKIHLIKRIVYICNLLVHNEKASKCCTVSYAVQRALMNYEQPNQVEKEVLTYCAALCPLCQLRSIVKLE